MPLSQIHSFLVHPAKRAAAQPEIGGTAVPSAGKLGAMLGQVFDRAEQECDIEIVFRPDSEGRQQNSCRDDIVRYVEKASMANGRRIASRLQAVTTHRSGLGLFFLISGTDNGGRLKLVVSRFPADQGIIAEEHRDRLSVEFIERVFMKSAKAYKSALYVSQSLQRGFWEGRAVDRQVTGSRELSDYWIHEFLVSDLRTTGPAGTKRVAVALRQAVRSTDDLLVRQELIAAATLLRGHDGQVTSARQLMDTLRLSGDAATRLEQQLPRPELMEESFRFDREEFDRHVMYRFVELDNGGVLLAEADEFANVFVRDVLDAKDDLVRYSTEGRVVNESLRKTK